MDRAEYRELEYILAICCLVGIICLLLFLIYRTSCAPPAKPQNGAPPSAVERRAPAAAPQQVNPLHDVEAGEAPPGSAGARAGQQAPAATTGTASGEATDTATGTSAVTAATAKGAASVATTRTSLGEKIEPAVTASASVPSADEKPKNEGAGAEDSAPTSEVAAAAAAPATGGTPSTEPPPAPAAGKVVVKEEDGELKKQQTAAAVKLQSLARQALAVKFVQMLMDGVVFESRPLWARRISNVPPRFGGPTKRWTRGYSAAAAGLVGGGNHGGGNGGASTPVSAMLAGSGPSPR